MTPGRLSAKVVIDRLSYVRRMNALIASLPLESLDEKMSRTLVKMAGYRNRLVHFYHEVTVGELYQVCTENLSDIELITRRIMQWIRDHPERIDEEL